MQKGEPANVLDPQVRPATIDHPRSRQHPSSEREDLEGLLLALRPLIRSLSSAQLRFAIETVNLLHFSSPLLSWQNPTQVDLHVPHSSSSPVPPGPRTRALGSRGERWKDLLLP